MELPRIPNTMNSVSDNHICRKIKSGNPANLKIHQKHAPK